MGINWTSQNLEMYIDLLGRKRDMNKYMRSVNPEEDLHNLSTRQITLKIHHYTPNDKAKIQY
jgi:hypothetical protein